MLGGSPFGRWNPSLRALEGGYSAEDAAEDDDDNAPDDELLSEGEVFDRIGKFCEAFERAAEGVDLRFGLPFALAFPIS